MQTRPRFICLGAVLAVLLCLAALAVVQPSARSASPAHTQAATSITISNAGFSPCPAQSNPLEIAAGTALTFKNTTTKAITVTFTFVLSQRTQTSTVAAGASADITPNFASEFTFTAPGFNQTCFVTVSEALPTPTPGVPSGPPPSGGGPIASTGGSGIAWMLWGALLTVLGLAGLGGTLVLRRVRS